MIQKHTPGSQLAPHQFFVNSSQRQLWSCARLETARGNLAGSCPSHGAHHTSTAVVSAPDTGRWSLCTFPSETLGRKCHFPTSLCPSLFALAENRLVVLSSLLSSLWFKTISPAGCFLFLEIWNTGVALIEMTRGCVRSLEGSRWTILCLKLYFTCPSKWHLNPETV